MWGHPGAITIILQVMAVKLLFDIPFQWGRRKGMVVQTFHDRLSVHCPSFLGRAWRQEQEQLLGVPGGKQIDVGCKPAFADLVEDPLQERQLSESLDCYNTARLQ